VKAVGGSAPGIIKAIAHDVAAAGGQDQLSVLSIVTNT
jgi:hypothetical protein